MEVIKPFLGSYMDSPLFLNNGKYGYYLNHNNKLYGVPKCFEKPTFKLDDAIKIIEFKKKMKAQQIENRKDFKEEEDIIKQLDSHYASLAPEGAFKMPKGASQDMDDTINNIKLKKKPKSNI